MRLQVEARGEGRRTASAAPLVRVLALFTLLDHRAGRLWQPSRYRFHGARHAGGRSIGFGEACDAVGDAKPLARAADKLTLGATPGSTAYKIGPHDVLDISVFKVPELTRSVQVADTGTINLPLVGEVRAAGRTAQELERDLAQKLGAKYLQSPQVTVFVKEYNSQRVTIEGAVKKPGVYPIRSKTSLLQLIAMADGLDASSDSTVVVFRQIDGKRIAARFDIDQIRTGQPRIQPFNRATSSWRPPRR